MREGKAAKHECIHDGELRRHATDAESKNDGRENAESLFLEQNAKADADVLTKSFEDHRELPGLELNDASKMRCALRPKRIQKSRRAGHAKQTPPREDIVQKPRMV